MLDNKTLNEEHVSTHQTLRKPVVLRAPPNSPALIWACARRFPLGPEAAAVVSQDHSAVSVSIVILGVQSSPPQELEVSSDIFTC